MVGPGRFCCDGSLCKARRWRFASNIIAIGEAERNVVLIDGASNVLAADEEGNTSVEAADGSGAVLNSDCNIIAVKDADGNVVLTDGGRAMSLLLRGVQHHRRSCRRFGRGAGLRWQHRYGRGRRGQCGVDG